MADDPPLPDLTLRRPLPAPRSLWRTLRWPATAVVILALAILGWRYGWPHPVETWTMRTAPLDQTVGGPASLDATRRAKLSSRVSGRVTEILVDRNDVLSAGQIVARVEQEDLRSTVTVSQANLQAALRTVNEAEANLTSGRATLANAQSAFDRQAGLRADGWVSRASFEQSQALLRESDARVAALKQSVERARAQADAASASVRQAQAQLGFATVRAPFAGVVAARNRNVGDVLTPGSPILEIVDPRSIVFTVRIDESVIGRIHPRQPAAIRFGAGAERPLAARVLRLGREVDPETREFTADVIPERLPANWALDQRAEVEIVVGANPRALVLPASFIVRRNGQAGVWIARRGRAHWRDIALAGAGVDRVEVLDGLSQGDVVLAPTGIYALMAVSKAAP